MKKEEMPISKVEWVNVDLLKANDYNPNVVFTKEMKLLKLSILRQGWIQPILTTKDYTIIDGFHRATLAKEDKAVRGLTDGFVPVVAMELTEPERMLLTIRINRAKGQHIAVKMSDIIKKLVKEYGVNYNTICKEIGATREEVELLMLNDVFEKKNINEETKYSRAWVPANSGGK